MNKAHLAEILELPVGERLKVVQAIWDSVTESPGPYPLTDGERELIDRRLEEYQSNPEATSPWSEVKARIIGKS